jgi:hypothetical protein
LNPLLPFLLNSHSFLLIWNHKLSRWAEKFIAMLLQMPQRGIRQLQKFQLIHSLLRGYVYLCLPTYLVYCLFVSTYFSYSEIIANDSGLNNL